MVTPMVPILANKGQCLLTRSNSFTFSKINFSEVKKLINQTEITKVITLTTTNFVTSSGFVNWFVSEKVMYLFKK